MREGKIQKQIMANETRSIVDILAHESGLSKTRVKQALNKGAVWTQKPKGKRRRLRRADYVPAPGEFIALYYDESILTVEPPPGILIEDRQDYSVWRKPPGLLTCGTLYGDHCSLMRQVERLFSPRRQVFLIHRLDREATGLLLFAHHQRAAAALSKLFQEGGIVKQYRITVLGNLGDILSQGVIDRPLDGKSAITNYFLQEYDADRNQSIVLVEPQTGRRHQIRRHFAAIGFPLIGDPQYGSGNKNQQGMQLEAVMLRFFCPFARQLLTFSVDGYAPTCP